MCVWAIQTILGPGFFYDGLNQKYKNNNFTAFLTMILHKVVHFYFSSQFFCLRENTDKLHLICMVLGENILDENVNEWLSKVVAPSQNNAENILRKTEQKYICLLIIYSVHKMAPICCSYLMHLFIYFFHIYFFWSRVRIKETIEFQCTWQYAIKLLHWTLLKHSKYCC